jgi:hypothetical protein
MGTFLFKQGELVLLLALGVDVYARSGIGSILMRFTRKLSYEQNERISYGY